MRVSAASSSVWRSSFNFGDGSVCKMISFSLVSLRSNLTLWVCYYGNGGFSCCLSSFSSSSSKVIIFFFIGTSSILTTFHPVVYCTGAGYIDRSITGTDCYSMNFLSAYLVLDGSASWVGGVVDLWGSFKEGFFVKIFWIGSSSGVLNLELQSSFMRLSD